MRQTGQYKAEWTVLPRLCVELLITSTTAASIALHENDKAYHQPVNSQDLHFKIPRNENTNKKQQRFESYYPDVKTLITKYERVHLV